MPEDDGPGYSDLSAPKRQPRNGKSAHIVEGSPESGCNVRTQDPENFDEEVKSLVTAWRISPLPRSTAPVTPLPDISFPIMMKLDRNVRKKNPERWSNNE